MEEVAREVKDKVTEVIQEHPVTVGLGVTTLTLAGYWYWKKKRMYRALGTMGLSGPKPSLIGGNFPELFSKGFASSFVSWGQKYGKIYGIYMMDGQPSVVVTDLDLVREVMVKKFAYFSNRAFQPFTNFKPFSNMLLQLQDDHWKHVRSQLSPAFSSGKIKKMMPAIDGVLQNLINNVGEKAMTGESVELKLYAQCFAMDAIAAAAFGLHVDSLANPKNPFNVNALDLMNQRMWMIPFLVFFPRLGDLLRRAKIMSFMSTRAIDFFLSFLDTALTERRQDNKSYGDFLQLLVEAEREGATGHVDKEIDFKQQLTTSSAWTRKGMSDDESKANAFMFLLAGFETTSTVLAFAIFLIAGNPQVMAKARQEVDDKLGKKRVTYETASDLTYLDMCVSEAMRLYPPAPLLDRAVGEECELGGITVKKGSRVMFPVYAIHRDPEQWPDPDRFDPERHTPEAKAERHPMAYMPFGQGPRNCIGMRLAQLEIRMAIATLLQHYHISVDPDKGVYPPVIKPPQARMMAKDGLWVTFQPRT